MNSRRDSRSAPGCRARCVGVTARSRCTSHFSLWALAPATEVIVPRQLTYIASVNSIAYTGAQPVFVDSDAATWQMDPGEVRRHITPRTRAIMPVTYGQSDMDTTVGDRGSIAVGRGLRGGIQHTLYRGRHVGTFSDISTFFFTATRPSQPVKAGMVVSNDKTLIKGRQALQGPGSSRASQYWHDVVGYNCRMTNIAAAIGLAQLERADRFIAKKRVLATRYASALKHVPVQMHGGHPTHSTRTGCFHAREQPQRSGSLVDIWHAPASDSPCLLPAHTMPMYARSCKASRR